MLTGNAGNNQLAGGAGDDTYVVQNTGDTVIEDSAGGTDLVRSTASFALGSNVENLTLEGSGPINGTGNALANVLVGNSGDNVLDGGAGVDDMRGGAGNDTYVVGDYVLGTGQLHSTMSIVVDASLGLELSAGLVPDTDLYAQDLGQRREALLRNWDRLHELRSAASGKAPSPRALRLEVESEALTALAVALTRGAGSNAFAERAIDLYFHIRASPGKRAPGSQR